MLFPVFWHERLKTIVCGSFPHSEEARWSLSSKLNEGNIFLVLWCFEEYKHQGIFTDNFHWPPRLATEAQWYFYWPVASGPLLKLNPGKPLQMQHDGYKKQTVKIRSSSQEKWVFDYWIKKNSFQMQENLKHPEVYRWKIEAQFCPKLPS